MLTNKNISNSLHCSGCNFFIVAYCKTVAVTLLIEGSPGGGHVPEASGSSGSVSPLLPGLSAGHVCLLSTDSGRGELDANIVSSMARSAAERGSK